MSAEGLISKRHRAREKIQQRIKDLGGSNSVIAGFNLIFEATILQLLLLTWLVVHNFPFSIITSPEFLNIVIYLAACVSDFFCFFFLLFSNKN